MGVPLSDEQIRLFNLYFQQLTLWGRRYNLVSIRDLRVIYTRHFLDCLTPIPFIDPATQRVMDMGSGQGFPGIPWKIARHALAVTLLEVSRKKVSFLKDTIRVLGLKSIEVVHGRVEDLVGSAPLRGAFDGIVSRAAWKLPQLLILAAAFVRPGGWIMAMKGWLPDEEAARTSEVIENIGLIHVDTLSVRTSFSSGERNIYLFKKPN